MEKSLELNVSYGAFLQSIDNFDWYKISFEEMKEIYKKSGLPLKKFFNTSGLVYKELKLKDKLADMSEDEQLKLLCSNGMLIKRPLVVGSDFVLVGFKENEWEKVFKN